MNNMSPIIRFASDFYVLIFYLVYMTRKYFVFGLKERNILMDQYLKTNVSDSFEFLLRQIDELVEEIKQEGKNAFVEQNTRLIKKAADALDKLGKLKSLIMEIQQECLHLLDSFCEERDNAHEDYKKARRSFPSHFCDVPGEVPKGLSSAIEVVRLVWYDGCSLSDAYKLVAKRRGVGVPTVRDQCTRRMGLTQREFEELLNQKNEFLEFLVKKYREWEKLIREQLC